VLARIQAKLSTQIESKLNSCPHSHPTEHLAGVLGKQPFKSDNPITAQTKSKNSERVKTKWLSNKNSA
jgi:hypothetical protein